LDAIVGGGVSPEKKGQNLSQRVWPDGMGCSFTDDHHAVFWIWKWKIWPSEAKSSDFIARRSNITIVSGEL